MNAPSAYFELTNLMGCYANCISTGAYDQLAALFTEDARLELPGKAPVEGAAACKRCFQEMADAAAARGAPEFFSVFGQLSEIRSDGAEARCLWMYLSITPTPENGSALHQIGRIDQLCVKEDGAFKIKSHCQYVRTRLEPVKLWTAGGADPLYIPTPGKERIQPCSDDPEIAEMLDIANIHSRYEQHLHCGNWDMVDEQFAHSPDVSWTVGSTRKRFLAENPTYQREPDGPGYSEEPPYWMGAKIGHREIMEQGFCGMTVPFCQENQGLYCCSDMLLPLVVINRETGRAYTSTPSYGGFIMGPAMHNKPPYSTLNSIGRWHIEWIKEAGTWKMLHFCWSTLYEIAADQYDPAHGADWLSTHADIHDWPPLPAPYKKNT